MRHPDKSLKYNNSVPPKHYPKPEITAQGNDKDPEIIDTISIASLSSFPELLNRSWASTPKKAKKTHTHDCECEACELGQETPELDF